MPVRKRTAVTEHFKDLENSDAKVLRVQCVLKTHVEHCLLMS